MALFGGRRSLLQQIQTSAWKNSEERDALLEEFKDARVKPGEVASLVWHDDSSVRSLACEKFLERADKVTTMSLIKDMGTKAPHQRAFVGRLFNRLPDDVMESVVEDLLADRLNKMRRLGWEVALALGGGLRTRYLARAVNEAPVAMRSSALQRLLQEKTPDDCIDTLLGAAKSTDTRLANVALEAVSTVDDTRVKDLMIDRFGRGDATARDHATKWLREAAKRDPVTMRDSMLTLLAQGEDATRRLCVEILFDTGDRDDVLIEILRFCRGLLGWLRTRILETLRTFGDDVLKPAVQLLQHEDEQLRTAALVLAESFSDPRLVGPLCRMLADEDWWLRITACDSLGRLGDERAVPFLIKALEDQDCSWAAIDALAQIASPTALKPLAQLLKDPRKEVRMEVVSAFSRFTDQRLIALLKAVIERDASTEVRTRAQEVLRDMSTRLEIENDTSATVKSAVSADSLELPMDRLLARIRELGASDFHISIDEPPLMRSGGVLVRMEDEEVCSAEKSKEMVLSILTESQRAVFLEEGELDFCYAIPNVGRYRANAYVQRLGVGATFRVIPNLPPTFSEIRLPGHLTELVDYHQGVIIVSGPAGMGKSTTLAAIINLMNESKADHILTLEDPIEFVHPVKTALVNQREIGKHSETFGSALRGALREDPDVIMVGELRDPEVIRMALEAAETGHVVLSTMHTTSAVQTVDRLVMSFPPEEQQAVRMSLSESLKYVVCQSLVPRNDQEGRVAVFEILKGTFSVSNLIRDNKTFQLPSLMQIGRKVGMQTVDMALMDLVESGIITPETAWVRAENQSTFESMCSAEFLEQADVPPSEESE